EVGFSLPLPRHPRLLGLCNELIEEPGRLITLHDWAARLGTSEKTLMRMFQRETGLSFRGWRQAGTAAVFAVCTGRGRQCDAYRAGLRL
ncbi:helix-turn-helix, AraC type:Arac protein, arabinose-binding/dimerization, partial [Pseudomonas syringae pv. japonica str. M301072]